MLAACAGIAACALLPAPDAADIGRSPWAAASEATVELPGAGWSHRTFPGKTPALFRYARVDGRDAVAVQARSAASMLRRTVRIEPQDLGLLRFSWKVPALMARSDLGVRERADSPVRVILAFEGERARLSQRDQLLSELAHGVTGEPMPYATLMYVWCNSRAPGTVIHSTRTGRIRKVVLESGPGKLNRWLDYERDIRADFERAFGERPGALVGIAIMTDSDNTASVAQAWYGPLQLSPAAPAH